MDFFPFHGVKMEQEVVDFGKNSFIKSAFQKKKNLLILTKYILKE